MANKTIVHRLAAVATLLFLVALGAYVLWQFTGWSAAKVMVQLSVVVDAAIIFVGITLRLIRGDEEPWL